MLPLPHCIQGNNEQSHGMFQWILLGAGMSQHQAQLSIAYVPNFVYAL